MFFKQPLRRPKALRVTLIHRSFLAVPLPRKGEGLDRSLHTASPVPRNFAERNAAGEVADDPNGSDDERVVLPRLWEKQLQGSIPHPPPT